MIERDDSFDLYIYIYFAGRSQAPATSYSSPRHERYCRYNGCPFSLFIWQRDISHNAAQRRECASRDDQEVNREQCSLVFLRISRRSDALFLVLLRCSTHKRDRNVSLASRIYSATGQTGAIARDGVREPTVLIIRSFVFLSLFRFTAAPFA